MTRPHYELLALDLDGTLLDSTHRLPPPNRAALHRAHDAGIRIVLCTGRSFFETRPVIDEIGLDLDAAVTVFGAVISDVRSGSTLDRAAIELQTAIELTNWFRSDGYPVLWLADREQAGHDGYYFDGPRRHAAYDRWLNESGATIRNPTDPTADLATPVRISIIDEPDALSDIQTSLHARFAGRVAHNVLRAPTYHLTVIEAFAPQVNKWYGIERLCRRWGIDPARTAAVGDDVNDIEMLKNAGLGVAVANAKPEVLAAARQHTSSNDDCGVAVLIDRILNGPAA